MRLRWILVGLTVFTLAFALAACGGGDDDEEENGGGGGEGTPVATKTAEAGETAEAAETPKATKTPKTTEPSSGGGGEALENIPVYPGAEKTGEFSGDYSLPLLGEGLDTADYQNTEWVLYETSDSVEDVADFYKDKMPDNGWEEEDWFDTSIGDGAAIGGYSRDDRETAAWVYIGGDADKTSIVIGTGSK